MIDESWGLFACYEGFCNMCGVMKDVPFIFLRFEVRSNSLKLHYLLLQRTPARRRGYKLYAI